MIKGEGESVFHWLERDEDEDLREGRKRSLFFILLLLFIVFLLMNPGRSIMPGSGSDPQSPVQAADNPAPELKKTSVSPEIGPVAVIPDVMNNRFCTAVALVKNPSEDMTMNGAEGIFTITDTKGGTQTGPAYLDALPPGSSTYAICNYIPSPVGRATGGQLALYPKGWVPGEAQLVPRVTGASIESERARSSSGYKGSILFAAGRLDNTTGANIQTLKITAIGMNSADQIVVAESFYLYDLPKDTGRDFRYQLSGVYPTTPVLAKTIIEATPLHE